MLQIFNNANDYVSQGKFFATIRKLRLWPALHPLTENRENGWFLMVLFLNVFSNTSNYNFNRPKK